MSTEELGQTTEDNHGTGQQQGTAMAGLTEAKAQPRDLKRITSLAQLMRTQEQQLAAAEARLAEAKLALNRTKRDDLPALMQEYGLTQIKLEDGTTVELKDDVDCGITEENRAAAHAWLTARGFDGIIKTNVVMPFSRDERTEAVTVAKECEDRFLRHVDVVENIHPQTLRAFIRERIAAGDQVDQKLFGIYPYTAAKLTLPKK